jgi:hypothetical protein
VQKVFDYDQLHPSEKMKVRAIRGEGEGVKFYLGMHGQ